MATAEIVQNALEKKKQFILENLQTVTMKTLRKDLENDLGLEANALKPFKDIIGEYVDKLVAGEEEEEPARKPEKKGSKEVPATSKSGPRVYSKKVDRLRTLCRQATITIPPNVYVKNKGDEELQEALLVLMSKHGLAADAGPNEVAKVKAQIQLQRDLDGIDTSNIIEGEGRRGRRGAAIATNYRQMVVDEDSDEEEVEEAGSDDDESQQEEDEDSAAVASEENEDSPSATVDQGESKAAPAAPKEFPKEFEEAKERSPAKKSASGGTALGNIDINSNVPQKRQRLVDWSDDE